MSAPIYHKTNYRKNLTLYWQQYFSGYQIPKGYHVHHIKPKTTGGDNHPSNLIALHPDDHISIHKCRGDNVANNVFIISNNKGYLTRLNDIDENGLNSFNRGAIKGNDTKLANIDEHGLNSNQRGAIKMQKTRTTIGLDGLNSYQRDQINRFMKKKETYPYLFDKEFFIKTYFHISGRFKGCFKLSKCMKENDLTEHTSYRFKKYHNL